jgi:large subunit ribosomal protein L9
VELILTKDVPNLGIANEVVTVKDGYARNYLLPSKLAIIATEANKKERAKKIERAMVRREARMAEAQELADRLTRIRVSFTRKTSDEGRLFGSVTKEEICDALKDQHHIELDKRCVQMTAGLKELGEHAVKIKVESGIVGMLNVQIASDRPLKYDDAPVAEEVVETEAVEASEEE